MAVLDEHILERQKHAIYRYFPTTTHSATLMPAHRNSNRHNRARVQTLTNSTQFSLLVLQLLKESGWKVWRMFC